jgi:hypothetical protein
MATQENQYTPIAPPTIYGNCVVVITDTRVITICILEQTCGSPLLHAVFRPRHSHIDGESLTHHHFHLYSTGTITPEDYDSGEDGAPPLEDAHT